MATIALYSNQIAQMSGKLGEVKKTVADYKSELFSLKIEGTGDQAIHMQYGRCYKLHTGIYKCTGR